MGTTEIIIVTVVYFAMSILVGGLVSAVGRASKEWKGETIIIVLSTLILGLVWPIVVWFVLAWCIGSWLKKRISRSE